MGSRITIYYVKKNDYKRNINAMGEEKLEEVLDNSKLALKLDRKELSARLAKYLGLHAGNGMKVSIKLGAAMKNDIHQEISEFVYDYSRPKPTKTTANKSIEPKLPMAEVHTLTGMGLLLEAFRLKRTSKLYGGYYVIYA